MLKNEDIICISSIDWDFIWQGHQEIMTRLARQGNRVLFIENTGVRVPNIRDIGRIKKRLLNWKSGVHGIRKVEDRLYVYSPLVLPFPYLRIARFLNKWLMFSVLFKWLKAVGFSEPIVWTFLPTGLSLDIIGGIDPKILIYYCIDSFEASSKNARKIKNTEKRILEKTDLVFATSQELINHCKAYNDNVWFFPFGVSIDNFMSVHNSQELPPKDIRNIRRPIAGYVGGIHKWIDFDLVKYIATHNKDTSFVFCGPIQTDIDKVKDCPNVVFLGQKSPQELPFYVKEFDVALIPYRITDYTRNVYPTKLNEYLSLGKRVISTSLPEVIRFNNENSGIVDVAASEKMFSDRIGEALKKPLDEDETDALISVAKMNSWGEKLESMTSLIEKKVSEKYREREKSWKNNITEIYRRSTKRLIPIIVCVCLLYLLIFRSPLLWLVARPLQVHDVPEASDIILTLGGGVGESGKVGQGYAERVDTAVKLYKEGLADKIIYASGYKYIMKEAEVMEALSIFMGVDKNDIILDDASINTYEMIVHLEKFIIANKLDNIIIISSPYHMLRVKLLCEKNLPGINIYYVPVEKSAYYARGQAVKLKQLKGILHEYLAIVYYKVKGYI